MTNDHLSTERKVVILTAVLFLNLILVSTGVVLENEKTLFQGVVGAIVAPFQIGFQKSVDYISYQLRHYVFLKDSFEKYYELEKKQTKLVYENYLLKKKIIDQDFLNELKVKRTNFKKVDVISIDMNFPLSSLFIDKGSKDGIVKDMIVLNDKGELVGKIVEPVTVFASKVRLITCSIGGIGAYIDTNRLEGFLTGNNSSLCNFKYLIENRSVQIGDMVITSGTDRIFPPYIPIGKVVKAQKESLMQKIEVEPFFIKSPLKQLIVITNDQTSKIDFKQLMNNDLPPAATRTRSLLTDGR
jgi:rod shape-determining protein MreC